MKKHRLLFKFFLVCLLVGDVDKAIAGRPSSSLTVAPYLSSHMVLQRNTEVPVWGTATAGTEITVSFKGPPVVTTTAATGRWMVLLPPMDATPIPAAGGLLGDTMVISGGGASIAFTDVLVGEVWVLSGQSNINVKLKDCDDGLQAINTSADYDIRLYLVPQTGPLTEKWEPSNLTNTPDWSGVGFFFARALYSEMVDPVPIGLIQVAKNGTPIADWTTYGGSNNGKLYKAKIRPLQPFAIRGVIWYQGEDDGGQESSALKYYDMLPGLIANWRTDWGQGEFPFYYVQLALISGRPNWAIVRDAQVSTLDETDNTAMACIIDVPTIPASEIHPKDKEPVGYRLALAARALIHGETNLVYSGPIRDAGQSSKIGNTIFVRFNHIDGGLVTNDGLDPGPFMLADDNGVYYPATEVEILGDTIMVSNSSVPDPQSVRYCWGSYPSCNLFNDNDNNPSNGYGLPASPFQLTFP